MEPVYSTESIYEIALKVSDVNGVLELKRLVKKTFTLFLNKMIVKSDESGSAVFILNYMEENAGKIFNSWLSEINDDREGVA